MFLRILNVLEMDLTHYVYECDIRHFIPVNMGPLLSATEGQMTVVSLVNAGKSLKTRNFVNRTNNILRQQLLKMGSSSINI